MEAATSTIGDPGVWAQVGGLNGLVIFALFAALGIFLRSISIIFEMHRSDLCKILELHQKEREEWGRIQDARQKDTNEAINSMTRAISELNARSQRFTDIYDKTIFGAKGG